MSDVNRYGLSTSAAETYARDKVPALFGPLAEATLDAIDLPDGLDLLDVACGPGVVARAAARRTASPGRIVGADLNPAMIEVARREAPELEWIVAPAERMPVADASFDVAFCQQGLQFFPDRPGALAEMRRALRPGGRLVATIWAEAPPLFTIKSRHLRAVLGEEAAAKALEPFSWTDADVVVALIRDAGFAPDAPRRLELFRRIPASREAIRAELLATPNEAALRALGETALAALCDAILRDLERWRTDDRLALPQAASLFVAAAT